MPISNKEGTAYGGPGVLWHLKNPDLPKAPSQSRTQPAEFQSENRHIIPGIRLSRIPEFWHMAFAQDRAVQVPKRLSLKLFLLLKKQIFAAFLKAQFPLLSESQTKVAKAAKTPLP